MRSWSVTYGTL